MPKPTSKKQRPSVNATAGDSGASRYMGRWCSPTARTLTLTTNQPRPTGDWPQVLGFTNAPFEWGGLRWAAYMWDFTTSLDSSSRCIFMLHELFHRIQPELGLITPGSNASGQNAHLDTFEGRMWLTLEWRALAWALGHSGEERKRAVSDAIAFRSARRSQFENAEESERVEEIREGLAQYTGTVAWPHHTLKQLPVLSSSWARPNRHETFLQQSYTTGVAYGILLDDSSVDWRRRVRSDSDLGQMLMAALDVTPAANAIEMPRPVTVAWNSEPLNRSVMSREGHG